MAAPPPESGYAFVGYENLRNDIYPAISAQANPNLHQPGKVVLITGAGRGIGRAIALQYAYAGVAAIFLCARTASQLDEVSEAITAINPSIRVHKHTVDVSSASAVDALATFVSAQESRLDILVNNAGASAPWVPLHLSEPGEWWRAFEVNLQGPYLLTRALLPVLLQTAQQTGHVDVLNMASIASHTINEVASSYNITKSALCRLTEHVDAAYNAQGVNALSVNPGGVVTALANQELGYLGPCKWLRSFSKSELKLMFEDRFE